MTARRKKLSPVRALEFDEMTLDTANAAYQTEYERWSWARRVIAGNYRYVLIRDTSPHHNNITDEMYQEVTRLTKRECGDKHDAESWLRTYRGRAAMRAAMETL